VLTTVIVEAGTSALGVLKSTTTGHAFAFYRWRLRNLMWACALAGMMVPRISLIIPWYVILRHLRLSGTLTAIILTSIYHPVHLYLARNYFQTIPRGILEAARIDGASEWQIIWHIMLPLAAPIMALVGVFTAIITLGDYVWQSLVLQFDDKKTIIVGIMRLVLTRGGGELNVNPLGRQMAASVLLMLPMFAIFIAAKDFFIKGITDGGIKE